MSSDYLYDIEDNEKNSILLTMRASGFTELTILESEDKVNSSVSTLNLTPDETGWDNATKIVDALNEWVRHTKFLKEEK